MREVILSKEEKKMYDSYLNESLVSLPIDKLFKRFANYFGISVDEFCKRYGAVEFLTKPGDNDYKMIGVFRNEDIIYDVRIPNNKAQRTLDIGSELFKTFTNLLNSWGYEISRYDDSGIYIKALYPRKYNDSVIDMGYDDMIKKAVDLGKFFHISFIPPSEISDIRPKGGDFNTDFEGYKESVYLINTYIGKAYGESYTAYSSLDNIKFFAIKLMKYHLGRRFNKLKKYFRNVYMDYTVDYKIFRNMNLDFTDDSDGDYCLCLPFYIYELDIGEQFKKEHPWKLYLDTSADIGACYIKHRVPKSMIKPFCGLFLNVESDEGEFKFENDRFMDADEFKSM